MALPICGRTTPTALRVCYPSPPLCVAPVAQTTRIDLCIAPAATLKILPLASFHHPSPFSSGKFSNGSDSFSCPAIFILFRGLFGNFYLVLTSATGLMFIPAQPLGVRIALQNVSIPRLG